MKRIFQVGFGMAICSIIPILSWITLSIILNDARISNVFSITYAIQYVGVILKCIFASGANIKQEKEKDSNAAYNGMFWGSIFTIIIFVIPLILIDDYLKFFGLEIEFYKIFVLYGLSQLMLHTLFSIAIEKLYFDRKEKTANKHILIFNLISFISLNLICLISNNALLSIIISLSLTSIYVIAIYALQLKKFKIKLNFLTSIKYESSNIISSFFLLLVYLFGFQTAFSAGPEYIIALTMLGLCTDTQWDMMSAIGTIAKVDISQNSYNFRKEVKNAYVFTAVAALTSIVMSIIFSIINNINPEIAFIYLLLNVVSMFLYAYTLIIRVFVQLEYSATIATVIVLILKVIRTALAVTIMSPYCTEIALIIESGIIFIILSIIRCTKFKLQGNSLVYKHNLNSNPN